MPTTTPNLDQLPDKIKGLTDNILSVGEKISPPVIPISLSDDDMLSDREVVKKLLIQGGSVAGAPSDLPDDKQVKMAENAAHMTVYGKLPTDPDPLTPDLTKTPIKDGHPMMEKAKNMKSELKTTLSQLAQKTKEVLAATQQLISDLIQAIITLASSAVVLPFGAGVPTGLSAVMSIFSSLQAYQTKLMQVIPLLQPLSNIALVVKSSDKAESVAGLVNQALGKIGEPLNLIDGLMDKLSIVGKKAQETQEASKPIKVEITNSNPFITPEKPESKLTAIASQGTWEYTYKWTSNKDNTWMSTEKEIVVNPTVSTTYTVEVKDTNEPPSVATTTTIVHKNTTPTLNIGVSQTATYLEPIADFADEGGSGTNVSVSINMDTTSPAITDIITFSATIIPSGVYTYIWLFSGGPTYEEGDSTSISPKVSFSTQGQKMAKLTVKDTYGNSYVATPIVFNVSNPV